MQGLWRPLMGRCHSSHRLMPRKMKIADFLSLRWTAPGQPLIEPPSRSPVVADPSFLLPSETPDQQFHLFAHTIWGIHRFESSDGNTWTHCGLVVRFGMRPYIRRFGELYYLYYERYPPFLMPLSWLPVPWRSRIEVRTSKDLRHWSAPIACIQPHLSWHKAFRASASVSNPCVVQIGQKYRMYYSASLVFVPDCGFSEPAYIGIAEAEHPDGPWTCAREPILSPDPHLPGRNMGCGSMKVMAMDDGWIGLQNGIYEEASGDAKESDASQRAPERPGVSQTSQSANPSVRSRSALFLLTSADGIKWDYGKATPFLQPTSGWLRSHVYACDCRSLDASESDWSLYFNARDDWNVFKGKERIGMVKGSTI